MEAYSGHVCCKLKETFKRIDQSEIFNLADDTPSNIQDVVEYICKKENIKIPSLYFAHQRDCFVRDGVVMAKTDFIQTKPNEEIKQMQVRFRTIGDATCTGATISDADSLDKIIEEVAASRVTERGGRADDKRSEAAMEDRKKEGYF